jgi:hypothetical protein
MKIKGLVSSSIVGFLAASLLVGVVTPARAQDPPSIPRPPEIIMLGYTTDGNPIYGPAPSTEGMPAPIPVIPGNENSAPGSIPRPSDVVITGYTPEGYPIWGPKNPIADFIPPLFNPDGSVYGGEPVLRIPGATDAAPFGFRQDGTPVPPPLFNPDGTPFVLGVSPIPVPKRIIGAPFGYDALGTPVPAPLWNPDGTPYVHGVSEMPDIPANLRRPIVLTDPTAQALVNQEIATADISAKKTRKGYLLDTEDQISYVDKTLTVVAAKKGAKPRVLTLSVDSNGELFVPTTSNLKGFQLQIKRGNKLIKAIKLN